jgi:hypothetical protein
LVMLYIFEELTYIVLLRIQSFECHYRWYYNLGLTKSQLKCMLCKDDRIL